MEYEVTITKRAKKTAAKMPKAEKAKLEILAKDLIRHGPVLPHWPNYSSLGGNEYHCHLSHHWVACWRHEQGNIQIEVYYAGSREDAPY
jgi:mRNA-degrading endonuclease RelE of RelBE toxin-antitoxin system